MTSAVIKSGHRGFGATTRKDTWWLSPLLTFAGFSAFIVYSTWAAFQGDHYALGNYLSPFYSPLIYGTGPHAWIDLAGQARPGWWPSFMVFSPALLILWAPGGFRFTCYYYRGAYYKAFWGDPPACAVGEMRKKYLGENSLPLILQNVHRYFLYLALAFIVLLAHDAYKAFWFEAVPGSGVFDKFGLGLGTIVLTLNVIFLGGYTLGCHSFRHLVGGALNTLARRPVRKKTYDCVSCLNKRHMNFAWISLFWVGFTDLYVRLCHMEVWSDWRIF